MTIDKTKLNKIGIDRIVINNFTIINFDKLEKKEVNSNFEYVEKIERKNHLFNLNYSVNLRTDNELYTVSSLELNPNRVLHGHNIYNSDPKELKTALEKIVSVLMKSGIEIDLSEAKVKEIEINSTFERSFRELEEVLLLIGRANYQKALGMYSFNNKDIPSEIKVERSLYINSKMHDYKKEVTGKIIKFYDKTFELLKNQDIEIDSDLTRIEVLAGRDYYRSQVNNMGISNSLSDLIQNGEILRKIFVESIESEILIKPSKYLEDTLKKNLVYEFLNFKRNEKVKRAERAKLKALEKDIPETLKEERGVFEYLDRESWIFDCSYLLDIVIKHVEPKHRKIYEKQIKRKYLNKRNLAIYEELLKSVFLG